MERKGGGESGSEGEREGCTEREREIVSVTFTFFIIIFCAFCHTLRMYLWQSLCTLYLLACRVRATAGDSVLACCVCVMPAEHLLTPVCVDFVMHCLSWSALCFKKGGAMEISHVITGRHTGLTLIPTSTPDSCCTCRMYM